MQQEAIQPQEPNWLKPRFHNIPEELRQQPWGVWKAEPRDGSVGKYNKAPRNPATGRKIGADKPELFGTFDEAIKAYETGKWTGIGVLLTGNQIVGIDIDDAATLFAEKPEIEDWVVDALNAGLYCEQSPSRTGCRLFTLGSIPSNGKKYQGLEIYSTGRFLTVTGHTLKIKAEK
jgi:primase-polymerase (primpol)-like protein